ncbi:MULTISPECIES: helix-turn-helix domain-containing protein [Acetobacteraceae]|jgi:transcriptional regulator with XRE-family HTH domain|uniref:Transcriptional regulator XRE n=3 Tax=Acetobacteraceae TaxID=433 RepID=A0A023DAN8_ACIMT|nr:MULTISPECIES: helix-turn-helix transcriptional regulator [Acetobacteraceae]MCH4021761.1 helix-turn-helix domain-containing protein [Acetobacter sp.]MBB2157603.1 helix-turn-helix transcriptional regulator [Gluconacetobacter diazotrophicus]MBU2653057.1 helix-turn-helix domain-containing protein [Acidomonas methanolica]MCH4061399.1 helix-turn-helix domain-containing protein [Acetobacter sp.]NHN89481.1 helix-turn-helix domain-containing protein [Acetobacter conturbans]
MDIRGLFGANVRRLRRAAGLSQEALAEQMGVDRAYISWIETGRQNVTLLSLWHASQALGVRPAALLDESHAVATEAAPADGKS